MPQRLLQDPFVFPGYPVLDRFRDLEAFRTSVVGFAFRRQQKTEQTLRPTLILMLHFGLRAAQDVRSAMGVPNILVTGIRREIVASQSADHAGEKMLPGAAYPEGSHRLGAFSRASGRSRPRPKSPSRGHS